MQQCIKYLQVHLKSSYVKTITIITYNFITLKCIWSNLLDLPSKSNFPCRWLHVDKKKIYFSCNRVVQFNGKFNTIFGEMDFHTEFGMVLLFVYAFQNWDPFTNIHSNIQIHTYKLISWNQNIRSAHCMYRNRFIFNECISFIH